MMVRAETADGSRRNADNGGGFGVPWLCVRTRTNIDGILQAAGNRTVVFRSEQNRVAFADLLTKRNPGRGRIVGFEVLVIEREIANFHEFKIRSGVQRNDRVRKFAVERVLAKTSQREWQR